MTSDLSDTLRDACVVHVTLDPPEKVSGKARSTALLVERTRARGVDVRFVHPAADGPVRFAVRGAASLLGRIDLPLGKELYYRAYSPLGASARLASTAADLRAAGTPAIMHAHDFHSVAAARRYAPDAPVLLAWHGTGTYADELVDEGYARFGDRLYRHIRAEEADAVAAADLIALPSEAGRRAFLAAYPALDPERVRMVPNVYVPARSPRAVSRAELGLPEDAFVAVAVGQVKPVRRMDLLLDAMALVRAERPDAVLVVVGDGPERRSLESRARREGPDGAVRFVGWSAVPGDWVAAGDVAVSTSLRDTLGGALLEAAMLGRPVVAFDAGGVASVVRTGENGFLLPARDVAGFARALSVLAGDAGLRERMGARALEVARGFEAERLVDANLALYEALLAERSR